jgi:hypothetical protein
LLPAEQWTPSEEASAEFLTPSGLHELSDANGWVPDARPLVELSMTDLSAIDFSEPPVVSEHISAAERSSAGQLDQVIFDHVSLVLDSATNGSASQSNIGEVESAGEPPAAQSAGELSFASPEELLPAAEASSSLRLEREAADSAVSGHLMLMENLESTESASPIEPLIDSGSSMADVSSPAAAVTESDEKLDEAIWGHVSQLLDEPSPRGSEQPPTPGTPPRTPVVEPARPSPSVASAFSQAPIQPAALRRPAPPAAAVKTPSSARPQAARPRAMPPKSKLASSDRGQAEAAELFGDEIAAGIQAELASPRKAKPAAPAAPQRVSARPMTKSEHPAMIAAVQDPEPRGAWGRISNGVRRTLGGLFSRRK